MQILTFLPKNLDTPNSPNFNITTNLTTKNALCVHLLSGWGRVEEGGQWSRTLKRARIPIVSDAQCTQNVLQEMLTRFLFCILINLVCSFFGSLIRCKTFHTLHSRSTGQSCNEDSSKIFWGWWL